MKKVLQMFFILCFLLGVRHIYAQDLIPGKWPHLTGYWKFQDANNLTRATVGNDLTLLGSHQWVSGPSLYDTAIRIAIGSYYKCRHNIAPNGGGDSVNRYTLMFDFRILSLKKWHTFFQTDTTNNNDGECFIRPFNSATPGAIGVGSTGYSKDTAIPGKWYRLTISVNLGNFYRYYLNGKLILEGDTQDIDDRFSLNPHFLLFADNNQEDDTIDIASVAVFDTCLSSPDITKIGTIDPCVLYPFSLSLGNDTTICGSNTLTKSAGSGNYSYKWSSGETSSSLLFSMSKLGVGQKKIWVKKTDINNCSLTDTFILGIYNPPNVNLGKDTGLCQGQKIKLVAGSAAGNTFVWKQLPSGNVVSKVNNITIDSSGTYIVTMSNQYGCSDLDTIIVTVHPIPAKPSINTSSKEICLYDSAYVLGPSGYNKYLWNNGDTTSGFFVFSDNSLRLRVWNIYGCESPLSDSVHIEVHVTPDAPELTYSPDTILCDGDSTLLSVPDIYTTYIWNDGPGKAFRQIKKDGVFKLYVKNIFGCISAFTNSIHVIITPKPGKPEIEVLGPRNQCNGDSIFLQSKTNNFSYQWNDLSTTKIIKTKSSGIFSLMVRNAYNCQSDWSDTVIVDFHSVPSKPFILSSGTDTLMSGIVAQKYRWYINGNFSNDTLKSIKAIDKSIYRLKIGTDWCWSEFSDSFYFEKSGISNTAEDKFSLRIIPNPVENVVRFKMVNLVDNGEIEFLITDISGRILFELHTDAESLSNGLPVDISQFPTGDYVVHIKTTERFFIEKFTRH